MALDEKAAKAQLRFAVLQMQNLAGQCEALPAGRFMGSGMGIALASMPLAIIQDLVELASQGNPTPQTSVERAIAAGIYVLDTLYQALRDDRTTVVDAIRLSSQAAEVLDIGNRNLL